MFNKNDPLVDSVKKIMEQNEAHRQIEAKLCEELGIVSRKQLPHEHQANYDALLEERLDEVLDTKDKRDAYKDKAEKSLKDNFGKKDAKAAHTVSKRLDGLARSSKKTVDEADDSKIQILNKKGFLSALKKGKAKQDKEKEAYSKMRQQMVGKGTDRETTRKLVGEEEQLNEIGDTKKGKDTLKNYVKKASHDVATKSAATGRYAERSNREADHRKKTGDNSGYRQGRKDNETADKFFKKSWNRRKGIARAVDRLEEEMQDSKNPVPSSALERIRNKLGTGPKSTFSGSRPAGEGPSAADRESLKNKIDMNEAAKSKSQQRIMGMALAMRRGESDTGNREVARIATDMPEKELKKYAKTKHKGLPEKKK